MRKQISSMVVACIGAAFSVSGHAATSSGSMTVTATVTSACSITPGTLAFGNYNPTSSSATDASAAISFICTNGTAYKIGLNAGSGSGADTSTRKMSASSNTLSYNMYSDTGRSTNWGNDTSGGTDTVNGTASGAAQNVTVYGRIPALQTSVAGSYTDTVTVTIAY